MTCSLRHESLSLSLSLSLFPRDHDAANTNTVHDAEEVLLNHKNTHAQYNVYKHICEYEYE